MKFSLKIILVLSFYLVISIYSIKTNSENKIQLENKSESEKSESIMEFLNEAMKMSSNNEENNSNSNFDINNGNSGNQSVNSNANNTLNIKNPNILINDETELQLFKESWLSVSYKTLDNVNIFPSLSLPGGLETWIKTGDNYERYNSQFDEAKKNDPNFPPTDKSFYFRLSGRNLFYSEAKNSMLVLGSLPVNQLVSAEKSSFTSGNTNDDKCFSLYHNKKSQLKLCSQNTTLFNEWLCILKKLLREENLEVCDKTEDTNSDKPITYFEKKVSQPIILIPTASPFCNNNWNYNAHGDDWECTCKEGLNQSPIDLPIWTKAILSPVKPVFNYEVVEATKIENTPDGQFKAKDHLKIEYKNFSIQINSDKFGKAITLDGAVYQTEKIIFHTPSEHLIGGKKYDMEMQIIHTGKTKGDISKHLVLSFMFVKKPGAFNKFIDDLDFFALPSPVRTENSLHNNISIPNIFYESQSEEIPLMKDFSFYTYEGSLTQPPCSENTIYYVADNPISIGSSALQLFEEALRVPDMMSSMGDIVVSDLVSQNNRHKKPINGRQIFYYKNKEEFKLPKPKENNIVVGHYERIDKKAMNYYWVNNNKPSGMPGALVISKAEATKNKNSWG